MFEYAREAPLTIDFGAIAADPVTRQEVRGRRCRSRRGGCFASELLGVSDGTADQHFVLAHAGPDPAAARGGQQADGRISCC